MFKLLRKKGQGFTLIELMIVIAIIAILAAILVPNFIRARAQSQLSACAGNLKNIATALELYATDNSGGYPAATGSLITTYIRTMPSCPTNNTYQYTQAAAPNANFTISHNVAGGAHAQAGVTGVTFPIYDGAAGYRTQ